MCYNIIIVRSREAEAEMRIAKLSSIEIDPVQVTVAANVHLGETCAHLLGSTNHMESETFKLTINGTPATGYVVAVMTMYQLPLWAAVCVTNYDEKHTVWLKVKLFNQQQIKVPHMLVLGPSLPSMEEEIKMMATLASLQ